MHLMHSVGKDSAGRALFVSKRVHAQTLAVVETRAKPLGWKVLVGDEATFDFSTPIFGAILQLPATDGGLTDPRAFIEKAHAHGALVTVATDLLACTLMTPPGELGADIAVGSAQRFGVPMGFGGPASSPPAPSSPARCRAG
jgi:glycine dehydrogenase